MDPVSQAGLGACAASISPLKDIPLRPLVLIGLLSGMAPDLDVLIQSSSDPLLSLEYHRQFTHSLLFIPIGALFCALFFHFVLFKQKLNFKSIYLASLLGLASHAPLDACTTYGTQLLWPFSHRRIAWNNVSIIDPLFTLPLICLLAVTLKRKAYFYAKLGLLWSLIYLGFGLYQSHRAEQIGLELAKSRGHSVVEISAKPSFANLIVFKSIYRTKENFYVDAIRVGFSTKIYPGESIPIFRPEQEIKHFDEKKIAHQDILRFQWFSQNYLAYFPERQGLIADVRYSLLPHQIDPLWGIRLNGIDQHVGWYTFRNNPQTQIKILWKMIKGESLQE